MTSLGSLEEGEWTVRQAGVWTIRFGCAFVMFGMRRLMRRHADPTARVACPSLHSLSLARHA